MALNKILPHRIGAVMQTPTEDDYKLANKNQDDAIAELVDTVLRERPEGPGAGYSKLVYKTAWNLVEVFKAADAGLQLLTVTMTSAPS
jgi:hypothetical protein